MRVIGIDPGTANCGFAVLECDESFEPRIVDAGAFTSNPEASVALRVRECAHDLAHLLAKELPACVVVETPGFGIRDVTAAVKLWASYGAVLGAADGHCLVIDRPPQDWRRRLGLASAVIAPKAPRLTPAARRAALKRETADYVRARFPGLLSLLGECPASAREHAFDAIAIACSWIDTAAPKVRMSAASVLHP